MPNREHKPVGTFDSFEELFQRAEERTSYWVELGKLEFTEEMLTRMKERGIRKSQLAATLGAKPAFVTRLVSGHNNFTLETMVRVAHALNCQFRSHLQPAGTKACWIDVLQQEPTRHVASWAPDEFRKPETVLADLAANEALPLQLERHFFTKIALDAHRGADPRSKPQVEAEVDLAPAQNDPRRYQVTLRLKVLAAPEKKAAYTAEVHVVGLVRVSPTWPENQIHHLVQANGGALLYGAAREMLCNLTARGPWPMLCIHSVTFVQAPAPRSPQPPSAAAELAKR